MEQLVSYISIGLVMLIGVLIIAGYIGFLEPLYRVGLGLVIIAYAGVRVMLLYSSHRRNGKNP